MMSAFTHLKPLLGPLYTWVTAVTIATPCRCIDHLFFICRFCLQCFVLLPSAVFSLYKHDLVGSGTLQPVPGPPEPLLGHAQLAGSHIHLEPKPLGPRSARTSLIAYSLQLEVNFSVVSLICQRLMMTIVGPSALQ